MHMRLATVMLLVGLAAGCDSASGNRIPVGGTITMNDKPVVDALVTFVPEPGSTGQGGFGRTDAKGKYSVGYPTPDKGVTPGSYRVTVSSGPPGPKDDTMIDAPFRSDGNIPAEYSSADSTPLRATVDASGKPFDFKLEPKK